MFKRVLILLLCLCLCFAVVGCRKNPESLSVEKGDDFNSKPVQEEKPKLTMNPLTGVYELTPGKEKNRPVAITINNISIAQSVQTGLGKADIVYETEVEGGITRMVAVYQDVASVKQIGTVRSARYAFIDLAMGHNAIYVHHGMDYTYAASHLNDVDRIVLDENNAGVRIKNNLAKEHTLYAYGDKLWEAIKNKGFKTQTTSSERWQNFAEEDNKVALENLANKVSVQFSNSYNTSFVYDGVAGKYMRYFNNIERKDYLTGEYLYFKNIFVLLTDIYDYADGYHRKVELDEGDGYYFVNGTYAPIHWKKGAASDSFIFTKADGTLLTVNPGNSWVCIAKKSANAVQMS